LPRTIFHVDLDAFYASVEARDNPRLAGLPLVVGADPEAGHGRGVVVACSYEARKAGLRSGMPISKAYRLCPDAVYLRPDFERYARVSARVMKLLRGHADGLEQAGIDEAFLDVTSRVNHSDDASRLAQDIKRELRERESLTCSIGIGPNKSSAKIASDIQKPDGLTMVPFSEPGKFLAPLPVGVIPGVGKKTRAFMKERGIETIAQLQAIPGKQLVTWFGKGGVWLWGVAHGKEEIPVRLRVTRKSLRVERTFRHDVADFQTVYLHAEELAHEVFRRLMLEDLEFRTVGIKIRFKNFETYTRERSLTDYSDRLDPILSTTKTLLQEFEGRPKPVRLLGIVVSQLRKITRSPPSLDSWV
jgi:DNA polymerase IV (DinB-like DNA polymerase)